MSKTAKCTAKVESWDESAYDESVPDRKMTRATVVQSLSGDLEGRTTIENLMCYRPDGTAEFISQQLVEGELLGKSGTFVLHGRGTYADGVARSELTIVPGSGTGQLADVNGEGTFVATADMKIEMTLDVDLA